MNANIINNPMLDLNNTNNQNINNFPIMDNNDFQNNKIKVQFQYIGQNIDIYSNLNETVETICIQFGKKIHKNVYNMNFIYSGQNLNFKKFLYEIISIFDKERKIMIVIVYDNNIDENLNEDKNKIMANHVICPICKESACIYFENMKIKIVKCKYNHTSYLLFNQFKETQIIDESKIICNVCKEKNKSNSYNKIMYICNTCHINLCTLCHQNHDKNHNIIRYEQKYYNCEIHNRTYNSFCNNCKKDICVLCEAEHEHHTIISYAKLIPKIDSLNNAKKLVKKSILELTENITSIINKMNDIKKNFEIYFEIIEYLVNNYNNNNINYKILKNLNDIENISRQTIYKDLNKINNNCVEFLSKVSNGSEQVNDNFFIENKNKLNKSSNNQQKFNNINQIQNNNIDNNFNSFSLININQQNKSQQNSQESIQAQNPYNSNYIFSTKGLKNIGAPYYMNATLQCFLHVSELTKYFLDEYPKDQQMLLQTNKHVSTGDVSSAFYNLVIGVNYNQNSLQNKDFSLSDFKRILEIHNKKFDENKMKDFILFLLQIMHMELNYFGNRNKNLNYKHNQYNLKEAYNHFTTNYNTNNFSKISLLFYGTYKNTITCNCCRKKLYNFQKLEIISFKTFYYSKTKFNILDGFRDNSIPNSLQKFWCDTCKTFQSAETTCKIFEPPQKLLINIDYGKDKLYQPSKIEYDDEIDITNFVDFDYQQKIKYRILCICSFLENGQYIAYCRHKEKDIWYSFNDSFCTQCNKNDIYKGNPYLLLYERIFNN